MRRIFLATVLLGGCAPAGPGTPTLHLTAHDYRYEMPDSVPAGLYRVVLVNRASQLHEALITRLSGDSSSSARYVDSVRAGVTFPAFATDHGGPGLVQPGDSLVAWLTLEPGRYAIVCWMGDHLRRGMARELVVTPAAAISAAPPRADATLTMAEYAFAGDRALGPGSHVVRIMNQGTEAHEAGLFRLPAGVTVRQQLAWLDSEEGPSPGISAGGIADLAPGGSILVQVDLTPGRYLWFCTVPDSSGRPHYTLGMLSEFEVK